MHYYEVLPASRNFFGGEPLTYCSADIFKPGQIVACSIRDKAGLGIIISSAKKPGFEVKPIISTTPIAELTPEHFKLLDWMLKFYPGAPGPTAAIFAPTFLNSHRKAPVEKVEHSKNNLEDEKLPPLTHEQTNAKKIIDVSDKAKTFIVHGETGSGKTRLYIELAKDTFKQNKSAIILTPEISLTAPIAKEFRAVFGDSVLVNHSSLTLKERLSLWLKTVSDTRRFILIGPRSTLFLPLPNIGLIVVDEFHEPAYKQETRPYYHANRVASMLAYLSSARLIFGSATPPINDYYLANQKGAPIIRMRYPAKTGKPLKYKQIVVNLADKNESSGYPLLSKTLIKKIDEALTGKSQVLLFINKRGSSRSVACQDCGWRSLCINCELPLVYHHDQHKMRCHTCGYVGLPPNQCPKCSSIQIFFSSPGTKEIARNLARLFPSAKVVRYDKDNKTHERIDLNYQDLVSGKSDIIVGTQIIAKGHDLPNLSLVAMLLADGSLDFPDFSSEERAFQLLKQLSGRVGRGHRDGTVVLQTFNPKRGLFRSINSPDAWDKFYVSEIKQRKLIGFPPVYNALKIEVSKKTRASAEQVLNKLKDNLAESYRDLNILGPSPEFVEKKSTNWHWQLVIMAKNRSVLAAIAKSLPSSFKANIDPLNFL